MPAIAEHMCQSCGKRTWGDVPKRTDTMPGCECGGRRQIVRIRHTAQHLQGPGLSAADVLWTDTEEARGGSHDGVGCED